MSEQVSEGTGRPMTAQPMISGWRRFFTGSYWRFQWMFLRTGRRPMNILAVGTLEVPEDPELKALLTGHVYTQEEWDAKRRAWGEIA